MFVCLSVGMWRAYGNPNPWTNLNEILQAHPHLSKEGFGLGLTPNPSPIFLPQPGGPETLKAKKNIFESKTKDV